MHRGFTEHFFHNFSPLPCRLILGLTPRVLYMLGKCSQSEQTLTRPALHTVGLLPDFMGSALVTQDLRCVETLGALQHP